MKCPVDPDGELFLDIVIVAVVLLSLLAILSVCDGG